MFNPGDIVIADFPGVLGVKRRPAVILSSALYQQTRPDVIIGLLTSQTSDAVGPTDYALRDWKALGLRRPTAFRAFLATVSQTDIDRRVATHGEPDLGGVLECVRKALMDLVGNLIMEAGIQVKIWFDAEGDSLEVLFSESPGYMRETNNDAIMERVDENGRILGFSIMNVSRLAKEKPLVAELIAKAV